MQADELKQMKKIIEGIVRAEIKKLGLLEFIEKEFKEINSRLSEENIEKIVKKVVEKQGFRWD